MIDPAITTLRPLGITERGTFMSSHAIIAALAVAILFTLAGPPAAEAQRKKIVNIDA